MPSYPIPSCPVTITGPNANGFSLEPKKSKEGMRTEMGSTRMRRYNTANVYVINAEFNFPTIQQFNDFLIWLKYETNYGNLWFKADWFSDLGFDAGDWVFRFVSLPFSNTGYSQTHNATLLMGPYNENVVSGDYTELGIGGEFIDQDFPFGYEEFECTDLSYYRTFFFDGDTLEMKTIDWNESNWTPIGTPFDLSGSIEDYNLRDMEAMRADHCAIINGWLSCKLRMMKFNNADGTWSQLGSATVLTGYSTLKSKITRLSDTDIALYDGGLKTLTTWRFNYTTNVWTIVGSSFPLASYNTGLGGMTEDIACIGNNRIAFIYHEGAGSGSVTTKLVTLSFSGSAWSQVGNKLTVYSSSTNGAFYSISATEINKIVLTSDTNTGASHTYEKRLTKFTFDGTTNWTAGTVSDQYANGGVPKLAVIAVDKVGLYRSNTSDMVMIESNFTGVTFVEAGNELIINSGIAVSNSVLTSFFIPE